MRIRSPSSTSAIGPAGSGLGADVADDRAAACAGKAPVGDESYAGSERRVCADGLAGIEHLGHPAAARTLIADKDRVAVQHGRDAEFVRDGGQVHRRVGGAGDRGMDHDGLVAACDEYAAVKSACVRLRLHQIDDGFTVGEGVIDAVVSLCDTVAQIGGKIAGGFAAVLVDRLHGLSYKLIEMRAAGMAVAKGALYHDLGFAQIINRPSHADLQRIALWCKCAYLLRM